MVTLINFRKCSNMVLIYSVSETIKTLVTLYFILQFVMTTYS